MVETSATGERSPVTAKRKHEDDDTNNNGDEGASSSAPDAPAKRAKTVGPAMPPPGMIPQTSGSSEDSDDDEDYGPALPPPKGAAPDDKESTSKVEAARTATTSDSGTSQAVDAGKRDDWMLRPPDEVDLSSRIDPTKLRNRKFNSGPSRPKPSTGPSKMWTETPDEKRKRLEDEVMGIQAPASADADKPKAQQPSEEADAMSKQVRDYNVCLTPIICYK